MYTPKVFSGTTNGKKPQELFIFQSSLLLSIQTDLVVGSFYLGNYVSLLLHSKSFIFLLHSNLFSANFKFFSIPFSPVISETVSIHLFFSFLVLSFCHLILYTLSVLFQLILWPHDQKIDIVYKLSFLKVWGLLTSFYLVLQCLVPYQST